MAQSKYSNGNHALAVCDRCHLPYKYQELMADGNSPGVRVCRLCYDIRDPYRLPPRQPDCFILKYPRPLPVIIANSYKVDPIPILATSQIQGGVPIITNTGGYNSGNIGVTGILPEEIIPISNPIENPFPENYSARISKKSKKNNIKNVFN